MSDSTRKLHHDIRGRINALLLCVAALDTPMESSEAGEFLDDIVQVCDSMEGLMDQLEQQIATAGAQPTNR
ncbi:MAG: hypothetical protein IT446_13300 [Phycisphaerales bacterium]|nr:hypothetical protein [Phycisphaerales bacterium]